ncbi:hypothetical protein PEDI_15250 [Persicobacter diffluens]|uniref:Uncharacterized protein n=1 Tax=Persicobacter diffluens TaxID=981 RepID=A0AAN5ALK5_9BACT|nr:hypothetical protein PEDI_15250 [Persicobacter diffluens]
MVVYNMVFFDIRRDFHPIHPHTRTSTPDNALVKYHFPEVESQEVKLP